MTSESIYIISTLKRSNDHIFKIGKHTGTRTKLMSRYATYLIDPIIFYFQPVINYGLVENKIKSKLKKFRIVNNNGKRTEWIKLELIDLMRCITKIVDYYTNKYKIIEIETEHNIFKDETLNKLLYEGLNKTSYDFAVILHYLCKENYYCTKNGVWYAFIDHKWCKDDTNIYDAISTDVVDNYKKMKKFYINIQNKNNQFVSGKLDILKSVIKKLKIAHHKKQILVEAKILFYKHNKNFEKLLDSKLNLIGFENGVYDLNKFEFRDGKADDYITMSVGYDYISKYTKNKENLITFLEDITPENKERNFLLKYISTALSGECPEEIITIISGKSQNEKSKLGFLISKTLGDYFLPFDSDLLTHPRQSPSNLASFKNIRFAFGSEPNAKAKKNKINTSFFKFITGNDTIIARDCHDKAKNCFIFDPTHKMCLLCNDIPIMDDPNDDAIWERTRCIEFKTHFVDNPTKKNERKINRNLKQLIPLWKQDFMLLLIEKFKKYKKTGLVATKNILKFTKTYKDESDPILKFLEEQTEKAETHIHTSVLYTAFAKWFKNYNPQTSIPNNRTFVSGLRNHITIKQVRVNTKTTLGTENRRIIHDDDNFFD